LGWEIIGGGAKPKREKTGKSMTRRAGTLTAREQGNGNTQKNHQAKGGKAAAKVEKWKKKRGRQHKKASLLE